MEDAKNHLLNHHEQSSHELTGTKAACTRPAWVCSRASEFLVSLPVQWFLWDYWVYKQAVRSLIYVSSLGSLSFCWFFLFNSAVIDFVLSFIFYFDKNFKWMNVNIPTKREVSNWMITYICREKKQNKTVFSNRMTFHISTIPGQVSFQD